MAGVSMACHVPAQNQAYLLKKKKKKKKNLVLKSATVPAETASATQSLCISGEGEVLQKVCIGVSMVILKKCEI